MQTRERTNVPGIYRRGDRLQVTYRDRYGKQRSKMARTMAEARRLKAQLETDAQRGRVPDSTLTLEAYTQHWLAHYRGRTRNGVAESTLVTYERVLRLHVVPLLGRVRLSALEPRDVKELLTDLEGTMAFNTRRDVLSVIKLVLQTAVSDGLLSTDPSDSLRVARESKDRRVDPTLTLDEADTTRKALSKQELRRLLDEAGEQRLMLQFLYETGLRIGELVAVQFQNLDLANRRLLVNRQLRRGRWTLPKGGKTRVVPLSTSIVAQLQKLGGEPTARVFPISDQTFSERLKPIKQAAGLDWVTAHTFRHTCGTHLFQRGANIKQVQLWLGHSNAAFTLKTYVHQFPDDLPDADLFSG